MTRKSSGKGTRNVLADLGFDDADELSAKTQLALKLNKLIDARGLTQTQAAELLEMPQPKVSAIRRYKLQGVSLERLMQALVALDCSVEIIVRPTRTREASIRVAA
jgi:predicted XRE-type DNA-binding protein